MPNVTMFICGVQFLWSSGHCVSLRNIFFSAMAYSLEMGYSEVYLTFCFLGVFFFSMQNCFALAVLH